ncbi:electron transfer flavoprotein subunit alpha/FixB family protein [Odoribacter sp. OttesenSCG-928-L07]|nr:electron transfer flavoprotein subunit alpha/FixB family protein [Odoribacter sp. OttesenSCG-928-L07]MDL2238983.1 electron transfer flavoprotein subunit alpha/FixB family protein [Bacteroidales bacterium OttesenSCG-928-L14]MDL2240864.1 electron transfer flavoprotein subunit alpha/FixB family protein [Bacteroidales bacterium OttesenSCG-928-K22]
MNNVIVYCEITEEGHVADVSLELLSKGRKLANEINTQLEAIIIGNNLKGIEKEVFPFGVDNIYLADDKRLFPFSTLPHANIVIKLFQEQKPEIALFGATSVGRDLAPRVASALRCGLTADCTSLEIGSHEDSKSGQKFDKLLYQIRPAFGGNIIATIVNPETRPQMATVREGVMKKEMLSNDYKGKITTLDIKNYVTDADFVVQIIERQIEAQKINIKGAQIIVAGGYGVGSKENFNLLYDFADAIGAEVGATRAAVDAGFAPHERQVGQTGVTVRPKLYIACGISGAVQHRAGMDQSSKIISINTDPNAPINAIADYVINGNVLEVLPKMLKYYRQNSK